MPRAPSPDFMSAPARAGSPFASNYSTGGRAVQWAVCAPVGGSECKLLQKIADSRYKITEMCCMSLQKY